MLVRVEHVKVLLWLKETESEIDDDDDDVDARRTTLIRRQRRE